MRLDASAISVLAGLVWFSPVAAQRQPAAQAKTSRAVSAPAPRVVTGEMRLSEDTVVSGTRILLNTARIVTNGFALEVSADTIEVRGAAAIVAFESAPDRPPGSPGRGAGLIVIRATRALGPAPSIDNSGEDGTPGARGLSGVRGAPGTQGSQRRWEPLGGCVGGTNGSSGAIGGPGGDGGSGGAGGHGGIVLLDIREGWKTLASQVVVNGGRGGRGGEPGPGGPGGAGGQAAPGIALCGGTDTGPTGREGPPGRQGLDGPDGSPGAVRLRPKAAARVVPGPRIGSLSRANNTTIAGDLT